MAAETDSDDTYTESLIPSPTPVFQLAHLPKSGKWQYTGHGLKRVLVHGQRTERNVTPTPGVPPGLD